MDSRNDLLITGPPTHRTVIGVCVVVCNAEHMQRNSPGGSTRRASCVAFRQCDRCFKMLYSGMPAGWSGAVARLESDSNFSHSLCVCNMVQVAVWRGGNALVSINKVNLH